MLGRRPGGRWRMATGAQPSIETRQSWVVACAALAMLSLSFGAPQLVVVALRPISEDLGARALPALASSAAYLGSGAGGVLMGWLAGRIGVRPVAVLGGFSICGGLMLAAGGAAWQLVLGFGLLVGFLGNGSLYAPMMTYVSLWFDRRRGTALALVSSGQYVAGAIWPALLEQAVARFGWQRAMWGFGLLVLAGVLPVALLALRPPPALPVAGTAAAGPPRGARVLGMAPNLALLLLAAASFICCIPMAMPAAHLVAFCGDLGIVASRGAVMLSVLLLAAFVSRQLWGWVGDRIGGLRTVLLGNICQTIGMCGFLLTQDEAGLFFVSAAYGLGFGGIVPSYVLAVRELFSAQEAHWRVPSLLFLSLSGMATGAWLAGFLYDLSGGYALAWMVGIGANLVAVALLGGLLLRLRAVPAAP